MNIRQIAIFFVFIFLVMTGYYLWAASLQEDGTSASDAGASWGGSESSAIANGGAAAVTDTDVTAVSALLIHQGSTSIPTGSTINGITVRDDGWYGSDGFDTCGKRAHSVSLSWNSGTSWTTAKTTTAMTTSETTYTLGTSTDTWGRTWSVAELDTVFRIRNIPQRASCASDGNPPEGIYHNCDYLARTVYYTAPGGQVISIQLSKAIINLADWFNRKGLIWVGERVFLFHPRHKKEIISWEG